MQQILIIRHGRTGSNKKDPNRIVIPEGVAELQATSERLTTLTKDKNAKIYSTPTVRALHTAVILAEKTNLQIATELIEFSVGDFGQFGKTYGDSVEKRDNLIGYYFGMFGKNELPTYMFTPENVLNNFWDNLKKVDCTLPVFIGHGGTYDVLLKVLENVYNVERESQGEFLEYGEIVKISF